MRARAARAVREALPWVPISRLPSSWSRARANSAAGAGRSASAAISATSRVQASSAVSGAVST